MIKICELEKDITDVRDEELGAIVGGGDYSFGSQTNPLNGVSTTGGSLNFGSTGVGYSTSNFNGKVLNETYSVKSQLTPELKLGVNYEGVNKQVGATLNYKTQGFNGSVFYQPNAIGFSVGGTF